MNINLSTLVTGREVSLEDMLDAREHRQDIQRMLLSQYHLPVIDVYKRQAMASLGFLKSTSLPLNRTVPRTFLLIPKRHSTVSLLPAPTRPDTPRRCV